jgi:rhodanese-related sulfurtransferase
MKATRRFTPRTIVFLTLIGAVVLGLVWDGCPLGAFALRQAVKAKFSTVRSVSPAELLAWKADPNRPPALLVDARPEEQYTMSHLDGAVRIDPAAPDLSVIANVPKETPIVVYDAAGAVGAAMSRALEEAGYKRVSNLAGGIFAWANDGGKLVDSQGPATIVHPVSWTWGRLLKARHRP